MGPLTTFPHTDSPEFPSTSTTEFYDSWNESWPTYGEWDEGISSGFFYNTAHNSPVIKMVSIAMYSFSLVLGSMGNGLVIFLTGFRMKRTVTTTWYLNLAVADFIFAICLSLEIAYVALDYHWPLGRLMCKLDSVVPFLNMFASVFFLTAISLDRCACVVHPVWALNHRTLQLASLLSVIIWAAALVLSSPYFAFRDTEHSTDGIVQCTYSFASEEDDDDDLRTDWHCTMTIIEFVVGFAIPFVIILACYGSIIIKLRGNLFSRFSRSFKIIVAVVTAFFCCWFPYHLFSLLEALEDDSLEMKMVLDLGTLLAKGLVCFNSCLNPLLYAFVGPGCSKTNWHSLLSGFKGAFSEKFDVYSFSSNRNSSSTSGVEASML